MTLPTSVETIITETIVEDIIDDDELLLEIVECEHLRKILDDVEWFQVEDDDEDR